MEFDRRFVHCVWDDALIDKEVVAASCVSSLITKVEHDDDYLMPDTCVCVGCNENMDYPFKIRDEEGQVEGHRFVYYDPNYICKLAHECGKQIQYFDNEEWFDITNPTWETSTKYRVKPKPVPEDKYVPYNTVSEMLCDQFKVDNIEDIKNCIWVRLKADTSIRFMIIGTDIDKVLVDSSWVDLNKLLSDFVWDDYTAIGK